MSGLNVDTATSSDEWYESTVNEIIRLRASLSEDIKRAEQLLAHETSCPHKIKPNHHWESFKEIFYNIIGV